MSYGTMVFGIQVAVSLFFCAVGHCFTHAEVMSTDIFCTNTYLPLKATTIHIMLYPGGEGGCLIILLV